MNVVVISYPSEPLVAEANEHLVDGARRAGHDVSVVDLLAEGFAAAMSPAERTAYDGDQPVLDEGIARHIAAVRAAEALAFVYPTTATTLPAPMKGWLERALVPGVAFVFDERTNRVKPGMTHIRRLVGVATYAEPWARVKARNDNGRRVLLRALRLNTGIVTGSRWVPCYSATRLDDSRRAAFLHRVDRVAARL